MATLREPRIRGMSVDTRPMAAAERASFGLPPNIDDEVRQRTAQMRSASPSPGVTATATNGAAAPPAPPTQSKMSAISQRAGNGLRGLGGAARAAGPLAAGTAGFALGASLTQPREVPVEERQRRENLINQIPGQDGPALPYVEPQFEASPLERFGSDLRDNVSRALPALPMVAGANLFRAGTAANAAATPLRVAASRIPATARAGAAGIATGAATGPVLDAALGTGAASTSPAAQPSPNAAPSEMGPPDSARNRDFTAELSTVPRDLPSGLTPNTIYRTRGASGETVYSGRDVRGDAQMVDGAGNMLRQRGTVSTVPGMSRDEIDRTLGRGQYAPPADVSGAPLPQGAAPGSLLDTPRARRAMEQLRQGRETLSNQRRGQDMTFAASMADVAERREGRGAAQREKQAAASELRRRSASYMQQAGGDPLTAARIARLQGDTEAGDNFDKAAEGEDKIAVRRNEQYRNILKPLATATDEDGKGRVDDALLERYVSMADSAAQATGMTVEELMRNPARFRGAVKLVESLNAEREDTWAKRFGLDDAPPISQVPNTLRERGGRVERAWPLTASGWGARRIMMPNGAQVTIGEEAFNDPEVRDLLGSLGVR